MNIDRERDALIVVDMQNDFAEPKGALYVKGGEDLVVPINNLMKEFDNIVITHDWHPTDHVSFQDNGGPWPIHCVQGTWGSWAVAGLAGTRMSLLLRKGMDKNVDSYSAFRDNNKKETGLTGYLLNRRVRRTYLVGLAREFCVKWSAMDAALGLEPHFVWDLTRPVDPTSDEQTRTDLLGIGVKIV